MKNFFVRTLIAAVLFLTAASIASYPVALFAASVVTTGVALTSKIAPGESLPLAVKLVNISGNSNKVDVVVTYTILDPKNAIIYRSAETVAVETTASFVKSIPIPKSALPGQYRAESSILYPGQTSPATSQFPFTVERKIFGFFQSSLYLYIGILIVVGVLAGVAGRFWIRRRVARTGPIDYSNVPAGTRVFYELISDTVMGMRQEVGERALEIAKHTIGMTIDERTGRILSLTGKPSKVIADLVSEYEKVLGKRVSFAFRRPKVQYNT
jgi:hypothetical protein